MERKHTSLATSVLNTLVNDLGINKSEIKLEAKIHNIFRVDILYRDFALEIDGPFHFIHDPMFSIDPEFSARK
jgi:hypothetical protein